MTLPKRSLANLKAKAKKRPQGYYEDVLSKAIEVGNDYYILSDEDFNNLKLKWSTHEPPAKPPKKPKKKNQGPGSLFSIMIKESTGRDSAKCGRCNWRVKQMNKWGYWGCWKNRKIIYGWLKAECISREIKPDMVLIMKAFKGAFKYATRHNIKKVD